MFSLGTDISCGAEKGEGRRGGGVSSEIRGQQTRRAYEENLFSDTSRISLLLGGNQCFSSRIDIGCPYLLFLFRSEWFVTARERHGGEGRGRLGVEWTTTGRVNSPIKEGK